MMRVGVRWHQWRVRKGGVAIGEGEDDDIGTFGSNGSRVKGFKTQITAVGGVVGGNGLAMVFTRGNKDEFNRGVGSKEVINAAPV